MNRELNDPFIITRAVNAFQQQSEQRFSYNYRKRKKRCTNYTQIQRIVLNPTSHLALKPTNEMACNKQLLPSVKKKILLDMTEQTNLSMSMCYLGLSEVIMYLTRNDINSKLPPKEEDVYAFKAKCFKNPRLGRKIILTPVHYLIIRSNLNTQFLWQYRTIQPSQWPFISLFSLPPSFHLSLTHALIYIYPTLTQCSSSLIPFPWYFKMIVFTLPCTPPPQSFGTNSSQDKYLLFFRLVYLHKISN